MDAMTYAAARLHAQRAAQMHAEVAVRAAQHRRRQEETDAPGAALPCVAVADAVPCPDEFGLAGPGA
jgi:hypothetical protein